MIKKIMIASFVLLSLTACNNESMEVNREKETNQQETNDQSLEETEQTVGYIMGIRSDIIDFSEENNANEVSMMFEMKKVDQAVTSKLKVGQKVRVTYSLPVNYSNPPIATPIEFEVIAE